MKHAHLCLFLTMLLLLSLSAAPAQAINRAELPTMTMKPLLREGELRRLYTEEGAFLCPDGLYFGMSLEEAIDLLPLSETMRRGEEAFDERKVVVVPDSGFVTLKPFIYYAFEEIDAALELTLEFNGDHELFGYWLSGVPMKLEDMSDSDKEIAPMRLQRMIDVFSNAAKPLVEKGPEDLEALDFRYFEDGGQLRVFFPMEKGTFCQVSANLFQNTFVYNIGIGCLEDWSAVAGIIENLR